MNLVGGITLENAINMTQIFILGLTVLLETFRFSVSHDYCLFYFFD